MKKILIGTMAILMAFPVIAQDKNLKKYAVVDLAANMMREEPDYAAEMGDQSLMGTVVEVKGQDSYWIKITSPEPYTAWVNELGLVQMDEAEKDAYIAAPKYIFTADYGHIYSAPSIKSDPVSDIVAGNLVRKAVNEKGKIVSKGGFVKVLTASGKTGYVLRGQVEDFSEWVASCNPTADNLIATAKRFIGVPYMWGGTSIKGVDCSGLMRSVFFLNGVLLPRNASQMAKVGDDVPLDQLQPGDLLFWGRAATADKPEKVTHVGMYIGNNKFIQSSQLVRINDLDRSKPDGYQRSAPLRARRIITNIDNGKGIVSTAKSPWYFIQK